MQTKEEQLLELLNSCRKIEAEVQQAEQNNEEMLELLQLEMAELQEKLLELRSAGRKL